MSAVWQGLIVAATTGRADLIGPSVRPGPASSVPHAVDGFANATTIDVQLQRDVAVPQVGGPVQPASFSA